MFLAWKELMYYKKKYLLVTTILILLIFMVLFLSGLANGLSNATSSTIRNSEGQYYILSEDADKIITRSSLTSQQLLQIKDIMPIKDDINDITPINLQRTAIRKANNDTKIDCTYLALDPNSFMMVEVTKGKPLTNNKNGIILNNSFIDDGIKVGDIIEDGQSKTKLEVVGFTSNESYAHSPLGIITLQTFQQITNSSEAVTYQSMVINDSNVNIDSLKKIKGIKVLTKEEVISNIPGHAQEQMTINMILVILLLVSAVILGVFFYVITIQKLPQFGTLKAIGTSMKKLSIMIILQVTLIAGFSVLVGDILTIIMASILPNKMPFSLSISSLLIISGAFVLISVLSSLFTLIKVAKVDPIIAIGGNE